MKPDSKVQGIKATKQDGTSFTAKVKRGTTAGQAVSTMRTFLKDSEVKDAKIV